jgi:tetratricopeptide (TPR) repeat protein
MDNYDDPDAVDEAPTPQAGLEPEPDQEISDTPQPENSGMIWRVVIGVIAIGVVLWLLIPRFTSQPPPVAPAQAPAATNESAETGNDDLTAPEATALANPESAEAQFQLGNAYYQSARLDEAVSAYQAAITIDPNYQAAYANLGVTYYQLQQFDLAARQYEKAIELNPEDGDVTYNLGALYLQQALSQGEQPDPGLLEQAVSQLEKAQAISPDLAEPHFTLGVAYLALNKPEEARSFFQDFLDLGAGQDARAKQEAESYLEMLGDQ